MRTICKVWNDPRVLCVNVCSSGNAEVTRKDGGFKGPNKEFVLDLGGGHESQIGMVCSEQ